MEQTISRSAGANEARLRERLGACFDIVYKRGVCGGRPVLFVCCDGLTDARMIAANAVRPLLAYDGALPAENTLGFVGGVLLTGAELKIESDFDDAVDELLRGSLLIFFDGEAACLVFGAQHYPQRAVGEPDDEVQEFGSREGFVETLKTNVTLVRRRLCTPDFTFETLTLGTTSHTRVAVCYLRGRVSQSVLDEVRRRLGTCRFDTVVGANYLRKTLDTRRRSAFTMVGQTQRPDTFCAKLAEGKVGVLVDGTPFALVVPRLFIENFQTVDDYLNRPYFATLMRLVRLLAFLTGAFLPGVFVAVGLFHQELLPDDMLYNLVVMESNTLFDLTTEALLIHFVYEAVREAGLRMPKSVGHAVSIVGALVIGDAAVTAGLIGAPMLIIVALTAICSLVCSDLYQPISVLRLVFILIGGAAGLFGITAGAAVLLFNLASVTDYGVPFLAPFSPLYPRLLRDTFPRADVTDLAKRLFRVDTLLKGESRG